MRQKIINVDPEILGGTPVFMGTRVPITTLFLYLERGRSLEIFLDDFPSVAREQAAGLCRMASKALKTNALKNESPVGRTTAQAA